MNVDHICNDGGLGLVSSVLPCTDFHVTVSGPAFTGGSDPTVDRLMATYTFDAWGNHQESGTFTFAQPANGANQIAASGYTYDAAGNLTIDGLGNTYSYDAEGKTSGSNSAVYTRDPLGQRVRKDVGTRATEYYYFGGQLMATRDPSSGQWTDYIYAGNRLIAENPGTATAAPIYRIGDHLDSLVQKQDASGNLLGANDVSPYGELVSSSAPDLLLFTQHERDAENYSDSALYRQYASTQGRWLSADPYNGSYNLADPQSLNRYAYLSGRPQAAVDPMGLDGGLFDTILEFATDGAIDLGDPKSQQGVSPAEGGYGDVANQGNPFNFSVTSLGYAGSSDFNTNLIGVAAYFLTGGGAPSNKQIIRDSLNQKRLHSCSQSLFGNANALNPSNAPRIQYLSPSQLQAMGHSGDVAGTNNPATNTAYFNSSVFNGNLPYIYYQSNYLHEAGNIISFRLYGNELARGGQFVGPNEYPIDPDSGASFERCIFGQRMQIP